MPRVGREKSESGVYHVMMRGINRQDIFFDVEDKEKMCIRDRPNGDRIGCRYLYRGGNARDAA